MDLLPDELLLDIFSQLSPYREQGVAAQVCRRWQSLIEVLMHKRDRNFERCIREGRVQWYELEKDDSVSISPRQDMSVCYNDEMRSVYVFGGISTANSIAGFNDLLRLDMHTLQWSRPPIKGILPPPLSKAILASYKDRLLLYSGWHLTEPSPFSPGAKSPSNLLFYYDLAVSRWVKVDFLDIDCPPPMFTKSTCIIERDPDLEMDTFYVLGCKERTPSKVLWALDLHSYTWEQQVLIDHENLVLLNEPIDCQLHEINSTAYSSALLVTSINLGSYKACLLVRTNYNEWRCQRVDLPTPLNSHRAFFKRDPLSTQKIKDTLVLLAVRPPAMDLMNLKYKVCTPKLLRTNQDKKSAPGAAKSSILQAPPAILRRRATLGASSPPLNLGPEFSLAVDFFAVFLMELSSAANKDIKMKWIKSVNPENNGMVVVRDSIDSCLTCKCPVRHGTAVCARGEIVLVGDMRSRTLNSIPVYVLRGIP